MTATRRSSWTARTSRAAIPSFIFTLTPLPPARTDPAGQHAEPAGVGARTIDNISTPPELPHPTMGEAVKEALHGLVGEMITLEVDPTESLTSDGNTDLGTEGCAILGR